MKKTGLEKHGGPVHPIPLELQALMHADIAGLNISDEDKARRIRHLSIMGQGMMVRDYFIAHAPSTPQFWFKPTMPPCPAPMEPGDIVDEAVRAHATAALDCFTDPASGEAALWIMERNKREEEIGAWRIEADKQRLLQWPAAWADEQLKQRAAWMDKEAQ
jgi:hypothetical protein